MGFLTAFFGFGFGFGFRFCFNFGTKMTLNSDSDFKSIAFKAFSRDRRDYKVLALSSDSDRMFLLRHPLA